MGHQDGAHVPRRRSPKFESQEPPDFHSVDLGQSRPVWASVSLFHPAGACQHRFLLPSSVAWSSRFPRYRNPRCVTLCQ